jgi:N-acetylmuramoyl-L-alanine amidase
VGSDTSSLQRATAARRRRRTAPPPHPISRWLQAGGVFSLAVALACHPTGSKQGASEPEAVEQTRAQALVERRAPLPTRAETVALADVVAIASAKKGKTEEGARLSHLSGDLRTRLWRTDQAAADAREALELYAAAAAALPSGDGCEADRKRALLAGELARDARVAYRELYLTARRQAALAAKRPGARSPCLVALDLELARAVAFRPEGEAMRTLEREGNAQEAAGRAVPVAAASSAQAVRAPDPVRPQAAATPAGDVVVSPKEESLARGPVRLTSVERFGGDQGARVVLHLTAPAAFQVGTLAADDAKGKDARVFVDIARASGKGVPREVAVGGVVRRVRVGAHKSGTRVVLDLAAALHRRVFYLPDPFRIVIDVSTRPPAREDAQTGGKRVIRRVVIDPGHGGIDSGAVGPTGLREKDVTLDIAHRVAPLLAHELKIETLLTRDDDTYVPLDLRTARANAFHADLFVSIHCNASENGTARGVQTFVLSASRDPEGIAARVAARENAQRGRPADAKSLDEVALIASNLNVGDLFGRSRHVAELLQRSALVSLSQRYPGTRDQGIKSAGFFVLVGADMPAVLFETAFISNSEDEQLLGKADYRQKLADAIVNAIRAYRDGK